MAASNFPLCLEFVLRFEGGFVNNPKDPGGATNLGVTIGTLSTVMGHAATVDDVKALTKVSVAPIYQRLYWSKVAGDDLPLGVDLAVFDFAVNSGPIRSIIALQRVLKLGDDGRAGPATIAAVHAADPAATIAALAAGRLAFMKQLSAFKTFGKGWTNRVNDCAKAAQGMVAA